MINIVLNSIKNASLAKKKEMILPWSGFNMAFIKLLAKLGYVSKIGKVSKKQYNFKAELNLADKPIKDIKMVSKPGRRVYKKSNELYSGAGILIVSTAKGLLTNQEAHQHKLGGEIICQIK